MIPALLIGAALGYIIGGQERLRIVDRVILGIASSIFGGLIITLALVSLVPLSSASTILAILSFVGGFSFGAAIHWSPPAKSGPKRHIVFEPDEDDDFDREIEEAFGPGQ
ncbi:MAG: hypothetical protein ACXAB9_03830 [Candidatus Thorarchaeota archaeon]|jgi:hypothetical protein